MDASTMAHVLRHFARVIRDRQMTPEQAASRLEAEASLIEANARQEPKPTPTDRSHLRIG